MIEKIKRIGHKVKEVASRIGHKVSGITSKVGKISKVVEKVSGLVGKVGSALAPAVAMINPAVGASLATIGAGAGHISRVAGKVGAKAAAVGNKAIDIERRVQAVADKGIGLANQAGAIKNIAKNLAVRQGRRALQDPATSMSNLRALSKGVGGSSLSIRDAYKKGQELGLSKINLSRAIRQNLDVSKLSGERLLRLDERFL